MRWRIHHKIKGQPGVIHTVDVAGPEDLGAVREWFGRFGHLTYVRAENLDLPVTVAPLYDDGERRALGAAAQVRGKKWRR